MRHLLVYAIGLVHGICLMLLPSAWRHVPKEEQVPAANPISQEATPPAPEAVPPPPPPPAQEVTLVPPPPPPPDDVEIEQPSRSTRALKPVSPGEAQSQLRADIVMSVDDFESLRSKKGSRSNAAATPTSARRKSLPRSAKSPRTYTGLE
uniref:Uncharacterized protein n=2 Tax=Coccolithus braarudii TaxID=221442 RepID=A0A7S0LUB2_9EUKA|mmetsp:Transcript_6563/g.14322  ORF Transcript_6563/g.14322 Transcript_6563/m.14322 type:complete len:150 (+) Transcript_6563:236-685(+)